MNGLLEHKPDRRAHFSLLLNRDEYSQLSALSQSLGLSRGSVLRLSVRNLAQTKSAGKITTPVELDQFWQTFRGIQ
jgi:hypothetical protein